MSRPRNGLRFRFSIASLILVVLGLGIGFAALRSPTPLWASALFTLALAGVGAAVLAAVFRRGARRAFWAGFATFGALYLVVAFGPWFQQAVAPHLITTQGIAALYPRLHPSQQKSDRLVMVDWITTQPAPSSTVTTNVYDAGGFLTTNVNGVVNWSPQQAQAFYTYNPLRANAVWSTTGTPEPFTRIGHSLSALLAALAGGVLAWFLFATRESLDRRRGQELKLDPTPAPGAEGATT